MREIPGIGLLRFIAAAAVLVSHVTYWTGATNIDVLGRIMARGDVGVAIFFAISAFLLTLPAAAGASPEPVPRYARKRFFRICPAYAAALLGVVGAALLIDGSAGSVGKVLGHVLLLEGFTGDTYRGFTQAWSLTTEASFYLLVPFLRSWLARIAWSTACGTLAGASLASLAVQAASASSGVAALGPVSTSVLGHATWFCVGLAAAKWGSQGRALPRFSTSCACAAVLLALSATPLAGPLSLQTPSAFEAAFKEVAYAGIAGCTLVAAIAWRAPSHEWPMRLGDVSYGLFLWHVVVLQVLFAGLKLPLFHAPFALTLVAVSVIALMLATASWNLIERPLIRWSHREARR